MKLHCACNTKDQIDKLHKKKHNGGQLQEVMPKLTKAARETAMQTARTVQHHILGHYNWARPRKNDIERCKKKQQQDKAALQRFKTKWNLLKTQCQGQMKDYPRTTELKRNHGTRNDTPEQSEKSNERMMSGTERGLNYQSEKQPNHGRRKEHRHDYYKDRAGTNIQWTK